MPEYDPEKEFLKRLQILEIKATPEALSMAFPGLVKEHVDLVKAKEAIGEYKIHRIEEARILPANLELESDKVSTKLRRDYRDRMFRALDRVDLDARRAVALEEALFYVRGLLMAMPQDEYSRALNKGCPKAVEKFRKAVYMPLNGDELGVIVEMKRRKDFVDLVAEEEFSDAYRQLTSERVKKLPYG